LIPTTTEACRFDAAAAILNQQERGITAALFFAGLAVLAISTVTRLRVLGVGVSIHDIYDASSLLIRPTPPWTSRPLRRSI